MTIKEVEKLTGLTRSNIRFYEKEKLINPSKNQSNGYKNYSEDDVAHIKKIAYLRTLGLSIDDIRNAICKKTDLRTLIEKQQDILSEQINELNHSKVMCERILKDQYICYDNLNVEKYIMDIPDYWSENQNIFKVDSVSFLYMWGSRITWGVITFLCLIIGILFYEKLPQKIPVQWSDGIASSLVSKNFIFVYPGMCIVTRYLLKKFIYVKIQTYTSYGDIITEYLVNYLCFIVLSVEMFSILFVYGVVENIVTMLLADSLVFIGVLIAGILKMKQVYK